MNEDPIVAVLVGYDLADLQRILNNGSLELLKTWLLTSLELQYLGRDEKELIEFLERRRDIETRRTNNGQ